MNPDLLTEVEAQLSTWTTSRIVVLCTASIVAALCIKEGYFYLATGGASFRRTYTHTITTPGPSDAVTFAARAATDMGLARCSSVFDFHHGPAPNDYRVILKDNNTTDAVLVNLEFGAHEVLTESFVMK